MPAPALTSAELFALLSLATDLGSGQPLEHGLATCLVARRLGEAAGVGDEDLATAHELALLHSLGCTSDATEAARFYGDDRSVRARYTLIDAGRPREVAGFLWRSTGVARDGPAHAVGFAQALAQGRARARRGFTAHCEVAERLAGRLGVDEPLRDALWHVFERWDGGGFPRGAAGDELPVAARLLHVARDGVALARAEGAAAAATAIGDRADGAYDPGLAALAARELPGWVAAAQSGSLWEAVVAAAPPGRTLAGDDLDTACDVVADFVDLKSVYTLGHSRGVAEHAEAAAWRLGLDQAAVAGVRRAALLHDLGRVAISNGVWDKAGALSESEREQVRLHPHWTERLLTRSPALAPLAADAGAHHERIDGSGYHRGCRGEELSPAARVLAVADCLQAMTEDRPHRPALTADAAAAELQADARAGRLDPDAVAALLSALGHAVERPAPERPAGLTAREVEVLRLLARGLPDKRIATELGIAPKTVGHHVQHVYGKLDVSTRAAAALRAVELGVVRPG